MASAERYDDKKVGAQIVSSIFPLHSGSYFGLIGVIVFLIASLAMPLFAVTGWIMYLRDAHRERVVHRLAQRRKRRANAYVLVAI